MQKKISDIHIGCYVDLVKDPVKLGQRSRKRWRKKLLEENKCKELPFLVKNIDPCRYKTAVRCETECPGKINGECFGYGYFMLESVQTEWDQDENEYSNKRLN